MPLPLAASPAPALAPAWLALAWPPKVEAPSSPGQAAASWDPGDISGVNGGNHMVNTCYR